jgi:hypothetical protein
LAKRALHLAHEIEARHAAPVSDCLEAVVVACIARQAEARDQLAQWHAIRRRHMVERHPRPQAAQLRPAS